MGFPVILAAMKNSASPFDAPHSCSRSHAAPDRVRPPATRWLLAAACAMGMASVGAQGQATLIVTNLDNDGAGSFRDVLGQANAGDTILFNQSGRISLTEQLVITQPLNINPTGGRITLDGIDQTTRLLNINTAGTVTLTNLSFVNGGAQGGNGGNLGFAGGGGGGGLGGAILAESGNVTLVDPVFQNNIAVGGNGGAGTDSFVATGTLAPGAGGGGLSDGNNGPGVASLADGEGVIATVAGFPGGDGGTTDPLGGNAGGNTGFAAMAAGQNGTDGTTNNGGGGGGGASVTVGAGNGGDGGLGGGGGGGGDGSVNAAGLPLDGLGGDGGFGGGGGGGQSNFILNPTAAANTRGGLGGVGGGNGDLNANNATTAAGGGGGAALGAAVFIGTGASLTLQNTDFLQQTGNTTVGGLGGSAFAGNGSALGSFLFTAGGIVNLIVDNDQTINFSLDANEVFIADSTAAGSAAAVAGFNKLGDGELRFVGDGNPLTGEVSLGLQSLLTEGSINLDANFSSTDFINIVPATVDTDVTLFGEGFIGTVINQTGRVNPGDGVGDIGTLTVVSQFNQLAGGNLDIEVGPGGIDLVRVVSPIAFAPLGFAELNGDVNFIELPGGAPLNTPLVFLEANLIEGAFDNTNTVFLDGNTLTSVAVTPGTRFDVTVGATLQTLIATFSAVDPLTTLDSATSRSTSSQVGGIIGGLLAANDPLGPQILDALTNGAPLAVNNGFNPVFTQALESQTGVVQNAVAAGALAAVSQSDAVARARVSGSNVGSAGSPDLLLLDIRNYDDLFLNPQSAGPQPGAASLDFENPTLGQEEDAAFEVQPFSLWVEAVVGSSEIDSDSNGLGVESDTTGITAGAEFVADDGRSVVGIFVGSTETDVDVDGLGDSGEIDSIQIGVYGSTPLGNGLSVNGSLSVGLLEFDSQRATAVGVASADSDGLAYTASIELLQSLRSGGNGVLSPFVGLEASFVDRDGFTESGAGVLNLTVDSENDEYLTGLLGVQWVGYHDLDNNLQLKPAGRVALAAQFLDDSASTTSSFTALPGTSFTSTGAERGDLSVRVGASVELGPQLSNRWGVFARYTGDFSDSAQDHIGQFGVRFAF